MKRTVNKRATRRPLIRLGVIFLALGVLCGVGLVFGWVRAGGDPTFLFSTKRGGMPIWLGTIWVGAWGALFCWLGVVSLRDACRVRADDDTSAATHQQNRETE